MWAKATGMLIREENGVPEGMYGAFIDISDRKVKQRDMDIIDVLTSEYGEVYFVDLKSGESTPYSMNNAIQSIMEDDGPMNFAESYRYCVENLVCNEDRAMMAAAGSLGNIMKELRAKKTFSVIYRDTG